MSNSVLFLLIAVGLSVLGTLIVWLQGRPRRPRSSVDVFNQSLRALATTDTRHEPLSGVTVRPLGDLADDGSADAYHDQQFDDGDYHNAEYDDAGYDDAEYGDAGYQGDVEYQGDAGLGGDVDRDLGAGHHQDATGSDAAYGSKFRGSGTVRPIEPDRPARSPRPSPRPQPRAVTPRRGRSDRQGADPGA